MGQAANVLGLIVSVVVIVGAAWGGLWAVNSKVLKFRDWIRDEIESTIHRSTEALRPNGGRSVGDLPDLVHTMRRENEAQHRDIGDRLTVLETRTERIAAEHEACRPGAWQQVKHAAENIVNRSEQ